MRRTKERRYEMAKELRPRPYAKWRKNPAERAEDAAHAFGHHLILHCRDEALATLPKKAPAATRVAVEKAVDTALHNALDMLEGFWILGVGAKHNVELALVVRVLDHEARIVESHEISPTKLDLPIAYWGWAHDRQFR